MIHYQYPETQQFRTIAKNVKTDFTVRQEVNGASISVTDAPTLTFQGTVKLHGCVSGDTLITLANGVQEQIKNIAVGTSILSYNTDTLLQEFDVVQEVIIQHLDKPWVELRFDNGSVLRCTADHPILTTVGWVIADELQPHHELITDI